jgi:DNA-binding NarL/FixJ family response regulator
MDSPQPFTILVVDDFELFRRSIRFVLQSRPDMQIVGEASDGLEAVQKAAELKPQLILLDAGLPKMSGISAAREIRKLVPDSKIILMSYESDSDVVQDTLSLGISGYFVKTSGENELLAAVEAVARDERYCGIDLADRIREQVSSAEHFNFELDAENKVFKAEFRGALTSDSVKHFYRAAAAAALLARDFRASIADFSEVTHIRATPHAIRELAALPPADPVASRPRVVVAPNALIFALARLFQALGKAARPNLHVVRNLSQALALLNVASPRFEPVVHPVFRGEPAEQSAQEVASLVSAD